MIRKLLPLLIVIALFAVNYPLYRSLTAAKARTNGPPALFLPRVPGVKTIKFGYEGVLSDVLWLQSIGYVNSQLDYRGPGRYRQLRPLYDAITDLDPYFIDGYRYGSMFLIVMKHDQDGAIALLKKGLTLPENRACWPLYYDLGAIYFIEKRDFEKAAENFKLAAQDPNAPLFVPHVADYFLRVTQKQKGIRIALDLWEQRLKSKNEEVRQYAKMQIANLLIQQQRETHMDLLKRAAERFKEIAGRWPSDVQELVQPGILGRLPEKQATDLFAQTLGRPPANREELLSLSVLRKLPEEPTGGRYQIDPKSGEIRCREDRAGLLKAVDEAVKKMK